MVGREVGGLIVRLMSDTESDWPGRPDGLRRQMDELDDQIVELLAQRADVSREVGRRKRRAGRRRLSRRPARPRSSSGWRSAAEGRLAPDHLKAIYREIIVRLARPATPAADRVPRAARHVRPPGRVAALRQHAVYVPAPTHPEVVTEVERGNADFGVIAIENSTGGPVVESQDRLVETRLQVCDEVTIPISHCLLSRIARSTRSGRSTPTPSRSARSRRWVASTCRAARCCRCQQRPRGRARQQEEGAASIAPKLAAEEFGLNVLAENIQDNPNNYTRFWVVGPKMSERPTGNDKTAIVFSIHDRVGTLRDVANVFAERDISLSSIQSRPAKQHRPGAPPGTTSSSSSFAATPASRASRMRSRRWSRTRSS